MKPKPGVLIEFVIPNSSMIGYWTGAQFYGINHGFCHAHYVTRWRYVQRGADHEWRPAGEWHEVDE